MCACVCPPGRGRTTRGSWVLLLSHGSGHQTQVDRTISKCPYLLNYPFAYFGALRTSLLLCCPGSSPMHNAPVSVSVVAGITGLHHPTISALHCSPATTHLSTVKASSWSKLTGSVLNTVSLHPHGSGPYPVSVGRRGETWAHRAHHSCLVRA